MQGKLCYSIPLLLLLCGRPVSQPVRAAPAYHPSQHLQQSQPPQQPDTTGGNIPDREGNPIELEEVVVQGNHIRKNQMKSPQNVIRIDWSYIEGKFSGSLMQSLEMIPGVQAMTIGSGQSKPAIRGLGFNRMIVTENGIKHEAQQWGEDHGLEIDQFSVDEVEIVKGPGSLLYGPDAIGGVILLHNNRIPEGKAEGNINLYWRSNNGSTGVSGQAGSKINRWYCKVNATYMDYADYKIAANSIQYHSYLIQLKGRRLRNTAGKARNAGVTLGFLGESFRSHLLVSNTNARSGFFADAHGLEVRLSEIDYDRSAGDIDLPYHSVNHFKVVNNSVWRIGPATWEGNIAFQKNLREEFSEPVSHGYMPVPADALERRFDKETYTATTLLKMPVKGRLSLQAGLSVEHQRNKRGGWGFVIPDFHTTGFGAFIYGRHHISDELVISSGVRADKVETRIDGYSDWYVTPDEHGNPVHKERAAPLRKKFNSLTWSAGINYYHGRWILKANAGKSFRVPTPKELGSDGVNYHIFRYEKGDNNLKAEESYQLDMGVSWQHNILEIRLEPFLNYFPNYIYLNPSPEYYEGLQMYHHAQARVLRYGFETDVQLRPTRQLTLGMQSEYLYAEQLSGDKKGYSLPFSPPWSAIFGIEYRPGKGFSGADGDILLEYKVTGSQKRIVPPEEKTKGYQLLNLSLGRSWQIKGNKMKLRLQAHNLLDKKHYDHTGFYRLIGVPEPGRNISIMLGFTF